MDTLLPDTALPFRFCPMCGSPRFVPASPRSRRCADCGFEYFLNSAAAVVALLVRPTGEILVSRRARNPQMGTLDFPGGFVDPDEKMEMAVLREMREETGLEVKVVKWLFSQPNRYEYAGMAIPTVDNFFLCTAENKLELHPHDDVAELLWLPLDKLDAGLFGLDSMRAAIPVIQRMLGRPASNE